MVDAPHGMCARRLVDFADPRIDRHPLGERLVAADVEEGSDLEPIVPRLTALEPVRRVGRLLRFQLLESAIEALLRCVGHGHGLHTTPGIFRAMIASKTTGASWCATPALVGPVIAFRSASRAAIRGVGQRSARLSGPHMCGVPV